MIQEVSLLVLQAATVAATPEGLRVMGWAVVSGAFALGLAGWAVLAASERLKRASASARG